MIIIPDFLSGKEQFLNTATRHQRNWTMEQSLTHFKGILGSDFKAGAEKRSIDRQSGSLWSAKLGVYVSSVSCEQIPHLAAKDLLTAAIFQSVQSMERSLECHRVN